ncbi:MAG: hypothetical protein JNK85_26945 [Verrucomicrobiales bacterium]|nr:hypothetical protein [Verrucomicrobiales bacterium]
MDTMTMEEPGAAIESHESTSASPIASGPRQSLVQRWVLGLASAIDAFFGFLSLITALAVLSVIPGLNLLSLGYLIHVSGRIAATGRLRDGWVGIRKASVIGRFAVGTWLVLLPIRFLTSLANEAALVEAQGRSARTWEIAVDSLWVLALIHIVWAGVRGGRLHHFLWPAPIRFLRWLRTPGKLVAVGSSGVRYLRELRLPYYFWLGARGFAGAALWLALPVGLLILGAQSAPNPIGGVLSFAGGAMLMPVVMHLPFLQANLGRENRWGALFDLRRLRDQFARAPLAFWMALFVTLLFALPLYLLKIELPPRELAWLPSLVFALFGLPARFVTGWALGRAGRRATPRHRAMAWMSRLAMLPLALAYVIWIYFNQFLSWNGALGLLEQHAFLVPAPLLSL